MARVVEKSDDTVERIIKKVEKGETPLEELNKVNCKIIFQNKFSLFSNNLDSTMKLKKECQESFNSYKSSLV